MVGNQTVQRLAQDSSKTGNRADGNVPASVNDVLRSSGRPLGRPVQDAMEGRMGHDFSRVRVHTDDKAAGSAAAVNAKAYAVGDHIVFGAGRYQPHSPEGQQLLAHELTHVVQQTGGALPSEGLRIGPADGSLEAQAKAAETVGFHGGPASEGVAAGVIQRDALPVARFSPAPGLFVDRTENSVSIRGAMELYGPEANAARAASIQNSINATWTRTFPDGYSVNCSVTVAYRSPGSGAGTATQIEADNISGPSHVSSGVHGRSMTLNAREGDAFTWTPAHEFGHIIGLKDRYSEGIISAVKGYFGGTRTATVEPGYQGNLMAEVSGALESKNVKDTAEENDPSPYWINNDNQVRDWVNAHSESDIGKLATANKLKTIKTLMSGWISDADVNAIARICSSVTAQTEASAVRADVDLLEIKSIGQRTVLSMAFSKMP